MFYNNKNPWTQFLCLHLLNVLVCAGTLSSFTCSLLMHRYRYIDVSARAGCIFKKKLLGPNPRYRNNRTKKRRNSKYGLLQFLVIFYFKWRFLLSLFNLLSTLLLMVCSISFFLRNLGLYHFLIISPNFSFPPLKLPCL